ncbi:surface protease GP63 [Trypanosoma cruzi]|nr:surface protease GP63 [Trypanosoma cruzi]
MHIAVDLDAPFAVHAGSCVWRLLSSSVAMRMKGGEGVRSPSLLFCGCGAPRVTALSWAPCPIEGGMFVGFCAASWKDEGLLPLLPGVVGARSVCVTAAGSAGDVSGDADAVVVPVDVSCAQSDGSLSYRVCVWRGRSVLLPLLRLSMRITLSVALMCACIAGMVSWVLCAMWSMRCTHVATVLSAVQRKRKGPPLPSR